MCWCPLLTPGILAAVLLVLVRTIATFELTFLTSGPTSQTLVVALYYAVSAAGVRAGQSIDAMAVIYMLTTLVWLLDRAALRQPDADRDSRQARAGALIGTRSVTERDVRQDAHKPEWQPASRYPDPAITALDARFERYWLKHAAIERLATGCRWAEGPVYFGDGRCLLWSDVPNNRILKWEEETGAVSIFRKPSNFADGNTRDRQGRLVTCEHSGRRVTRTEYDGSITVLADAFDGRRLNSPNDVVVKSDGTVWFTDPMFGISNDYEGHTSVSEIDANVYRIDPDTDKISIVMEGVQAPNGLCFSPDEKLLYLVESRSVPNRNILAFDVVDGRTLANKRLPIDAGPGATPDGLRCDTDGNLWCGWGMGRDDLDGVRVFAPDGAPIGHIALPERCANVCFGGLKRNRLFMAASQSVYALYVNAQGAPGG